MAHIQVLPKQIADMIAAGEVVERPASVVKELVENAVDAGSTQITVEIRHGGATYIRVTDNGRGIPKEEVPTAFLRHATSKLRSAEDLDRIGTLGFRGEALAAIAAVSYVQMLTKPAGQPMRYSYSIENSEPQEEGDAGCPDGTTVVVRDVFFSVPARYKYLKADAAESAAIHDILERQALAHPEISFRFLKDGKSVFTSAGDGDARSVAEIVLPGQSAQLLEVYADDGAVKVTGFVGRPTQCRNSRGGQYFFVNGRTIRSKILTAALERAYENQHMTGRFPIAVLYLQMPLDQVDVNAHPTKMEVRFLEEKALFGRVYRAVQDALAGAVDRPALHARPVEAGAETPAPADVPPEPRKQEEVTFRSPAAPAPRVKPALWPREEERWAPPVQPARSGLANEEPPAVQTRFPLPAAPRYAPTPTGTEPEGREAAPVAAEAETPPWRIVGEALKTYIIVEQGDKLLFIDKHAAHERLGFDALKAQGYRPMSQELLRPLSWRPAPEDRAILLEKAAQLEEFGFQIEEFGDDALAVRAAPDFLACGDIPGPRVRPGGG